MTPLPIRRLLQFVEPFQNTELFFLGPMVAIQPDSSRQTRHWPVGIRSRMRLRGNASDGSKSGC